MKTCPVVVFLAFVQTCSAQWRPQESGSGARLRGLSVVDREVAWASGNGGTVLRTIDGGKSWTARPVPDASAFDFRDIKDVDADTAYVLSIGEGDLSRIYKTSDGGATWARLDCHPDPDGFLDAIAFWDASHGLALGDPVCGRFEVNSTDDGGRTWRAIPADGMPPALPGEAAIAASGTCLVVRGGNLAWFATGGGGVARVFRSTDRGRTWTAVETPVPAPDTASGLFSIAFRDDENGVAVGGKFAEPNAAGGFVALTRDGGQTWEPCPGDPPTGYRSAVALVPGQPTPRFVDVGPAGSDRSTDGGRVLRSLGSEGFHVVNYSTDGAGWAGGENGSIAKYLDPLPHLKSYPWREDVERCTFGIIAASHPGVVCPAGLEPATFSSGA
ncbi:WD40/YVTN/BNR-like repeat-containing protein [Tautonia plasticadhaerens]|uniref:Ycf48-like protein n=1 Tax=Tautonia plasticadhaerens TaxID=2527974 RepID=A0A518H9U4_9BACT|nr:oxidoreductase [Tautonia plasticadhaerens]QDV37516.1 Ycf48-like protein precursor [Tautonia plasticadhaerens]